MAIYKENNGPTGTLQEIKSYLFQNNELLRYMFSNLDPEDNYSADALQKYIERDQKITQLVFDVNGLNISLGNLETKTETTFKIMDGQIQMKVSKGDVTDQLNSELLIDEKMIKLTTGHFLITAKNFTVDAAGNATFSGTIRGATIIGGSINIGDGIFEVDTDGSVQLGDFYVSANASNIFASNDGNFKLTMKKNSGDGKYYPQLEMNGLSSRGAMTFYNGQITGAYCISADYFDGDGANKSSYFYDIYLGKSWWGGDGVTETVQTLWERVDDLSDQSAKENIYDIDQDEALKFLLGTRPVTFQYKKDGQWSAGMIAQEVDALQDQLEIYYPLVGLETRSGKYRIEYKNFIPLLISSVKNLQQQIEEMKGEAYVS